VGTLTSLPNAPKIKHWSTHPRIPDIVLVPWKNPHAKQLIADASRQILGRGDTCKACVLQIPNSTCVECNKTPCDGGLWLSRLDAAKARMES
jgi:hypothetical protein